jgi:hypothetical protein
VRLVKSIADHAVERQPGQYARLRMLAEVPASGGRHRSVIDL